MPSRLTTLLTAVFGLLLVGVTVVGIITTNGYSQRPSGGSSQSGSGLVLYGGR